MIKYYALDCDDPAVQEHAREEAARLTRLIISHAKASKRRKSSAPAAFLPFAYNPQEPPPS